VSDIFEYEDSKAHVRAEHMDGLVRIGISDKRNSKYVAVMLPASEQRKLAALLSDDKEDGK
jgi:hypothetical protein